MRATPSLTTIAAGALAIARWRVLEVVIAILWLGAVACGLAYDGLMRAAVLL